MDDGNGPAATDAASDTSGNIDGGVETGGTDSNASADAGNTIDPVAYVRTGRGRHPRDCECGKCIAKRGAENGGIGGEKRGGEKIGQAATKLAVTDLSAQILAGHQMVALFTKRPEFAISEDEAKKLAAAVKNVLQYHKISINPAYMAYIQLLLVSFSIYAPRLLMISMKVKADKLEKLRAQQAANLVPQNNAPQAATLFETPEQTM